MTLMITTSLALSSVAVTLKRQLRINNQNKNNTRISTGKPYSTQRLEYWWRRSTMN